MKGGNALLSLRNVGPSGPAKPVWLWKKRISPRVGSLHDSTVAGRVQTEDSKDYLKTLVNDRLALPSPRKTAQTDLQKPRMWSRMPDPKGSSAAPPLPP